VKLPDCGRQEQQVRARTTSAGKNNKSRRKQQVQAKTTNAGKTTSLTSV